MRFLRRGLVIDVTDRGEYCVVPARVSQISMRAGKAWARVAHVDVARQRRDASLGGEHRRK